MILFTRQQGTRGCHTIGNITLNYIASVQFGTGQEAHHAVWPMIVAMWLGLRAFAKKTAPVDCVCIASSVWCFGSSALVVGFCVYAGKPTPPVFFCHRRGRSGHRLSSWMAQFLPPPKSLVPFAVVFGVFFVLFCSTGRYTSCIHTIHTSIHTYIHIHDADFLCRAFLFWSSRPMYLGVILSLPNTFLKLQVHLDLVWLTWLDLTWFKNISGALLFCCCVLFHRLTYRKEATKQKQREGDDFFEKVKKKCELRRDYLLGRRRTPRFIFGGVPVLQARDSESCTATYVLPN